MEPMPSADGHQQRVMSKLIYVARHSRALLHPSTVTPRGAHESNQDRAIVLVSDIKVPDPVGYHLFCAYARTVSHQFGARGYHRLLGCSAVWNGDGCDSDSSRA